MKTAQMYRRLAKLSARTNASGIREFTLEELCRHWWRIDKPGFRAMVAETPMFQFFLDMFEREDAQGPAGAGIARPARRRRSPRRETRKRGGSR